MKKYTHIGAPGSDKIRYFIEAAKSGDPMGRNFNFFRQKKDDMINWQPTYRRDDLIMTVTFSINKEAVCAATVRDETYTVLYLLTVERKDDADSGRRRAAYNITAVYMDANGTDKRTVRDVTCSPKTALELFSLVVNGCVTPTTLYDVIYDALE